MEIRRNIRIFFIVFFSLLNIFLLFIENNYSQSKVKRNLSDYKVGREFEDWDSRWKDVEKTAIISPVDEYIWELWNRKELVYFRVNSYTLEGELLSAIYHIEKGEKGDWQLTIEWDRINVCPYTSKKRCEEYRYKTFIIKKVEKVADKSGKTKLVFRDVTQS